MKLIYEPVAKSQQKNEEIWKRIMWIEREKRQQMTQISNRFSRFN